MTTWQIALTVVLPIVVLAGAAAAFYWIAIPKILLKKIRSGKEGVGNPPDYERLQKAVEVQRDKRYDSAYESNVYDVYKNKEQKGISPFVVWVHGGFFVTGDKRGTENVCTYLAANGITVVSMNYAVAPERKHPTAILQLDELIAHLKTREPSLDSSRIVLAGDSAGGQIVSEYAALLSDERMRKAAGIEPIADIACVKGVVLVCAPIEVGRLAGIDKRLDLLLPIFGRVYYGCGKWYRKKKFAFTKTLDYVSKDFPPTFLTDGNHVSFEAQNKELAKTLREKGVETTELFFSEGKVEHEYLFDMQDERAMLAAGKIRDFVKKKLN